MTTAAFEIVVRGVVSPALLAAFPGFVVGTVERGQTHLVGPIPDQARLHGLLEVLGELNIDLVSLNPVAAVAE